MKNILQNLAKLIDVKTFVTFAVLAVFAILALRGDISSDNVTNLTLMVVSFYFGTQFEKKTNKLNGGE